MEEVYERNVQGLTNLVSQEHSTNATECLVVFAIKQASPGSINISMGIPVHSAATKA